MSRVSNLLAASVVVLLVAACGSSAVSPSEGGPDATDPPAATQPGGATPGTNATDPPEASDPPVATPGSGGGGGGSTDLAPAIPDGTALNGTATAEVSGDRSFTFQASGTGFVDGGFASVLYLDAAAGGSIQVTISGVEGSAGIAITSETFATGGAAGEDCEVTLSRNDPSGIEGEFRCSDLPAIEGATSLTVDARGTFSMQP